MIESWGRGFEKIANYCKEENAKIPEIDLSLGGITARCYASDYYIELMSEHNEVNEVNISENIANNCPEIAQRLHRDCPEIAQRTYLFIKNNPTATIKEIHQSLNISERTVKNHIALLRDKFIKRIGSDTKGYWEIIDE